MIRRPPRTTPSYTLFPYTALFLSEYRREDAFRVGAGQRVLVGMADAGRLDLDQHFAGLGAVELHGFDRQRLAGVKRDGGTDIHGPGSGTREGGHCKQRVWRGADARRTPAPRLSWPASKSHSFRRAQRPHTPDL